MSSCLISKVYELWEERVLVFECRSECRGWIWLKRIIYWKSIKLWLHNLERYFNLWPFYCHRWWTQLSLSCTWWGTLWDCKSGRSPSQKSWCLTSLESDSKINSLTKWTFKSKINRKKTNNKERCYLSHRQPQQTCGKVTCGFTNAARHKGFIAFQFCSSIWPSVLQSLSSARHEGSQGPCQ